MPYNYDAPFEIRDIRNGEWYWVQKEVLTSKKINASDKLVYSALAFFSNNKTQQAYPSVRGIADLVGIHRNTVVKSIKALVDNKFISAKKKDGKRSFYELLKLTVTKFVPPKTVTNENDSVTNQNTTVTNKELVTVTNGNTNNTYTNNTKKQELLNKKTPSSPNGELLILLEKFNILFHTNYQITEGRCKKFLTRRKLFNIGQLLQATENLYSSSFHRGENERGWKADPDFLLRSDEQVDKWLNYEKPKVRDVIAIIRP